MDFHSNLKLVFDSQDKHRFPLGFASEEAKWEVLLGMIFGDGILNFLLMHACASYFDSMFVLYCLSRFKWISCSIMMKWLTVTVSGG